MTEDAQLKEHNLRKFDKYVHIEQLVDATYHSNLASATPDATPESEEIFEAGNVPSSTGQVINGVKFEISLI